MFTRRKMIRSSLFSLGMAAIPGLIDVKAASNSYGIVGRIAPELKVNYWIDKNGHESNFQLADN